MKMGKHLLSMLLGKGADPAIASEMGITALHHAAGNGQEDSVKLLLEQKANPNAETDEGVTPLLGAVAAGSLRCVQLLVKAGARANVIAGGATPLHIAAFNGSPEMIKTLLEGGADPNVVDVEGLKPIQVAAGMGNRVAVTLLFPITSQIQGVPEWNVDGLIEYMKFQEAKKKASKAKARGQDSSGRKNYAMGVDAYTQAIDYDPSDATLLSNRSLCWLHATAQALADAKACRVRNSDQIEKIIVKLPFEL